VAVVAAPLDATALLGPMMVPNFAKINASLWEE
jgi:hypothetical protein